MTPQDALDAIQSRLEAYESHVGNDGMTPEMLDAISTLKTYIDESDELEWGDPGDCEDRMYNDEDLRAEIREKTMDSADWVDIPDEELQQRAIKLGLGRHYGTPHCIWCLQSQ